MDIALGYWLYVLHIVLIVPTTHRRSFTKFGAAWNKTWPEKRANLLNTKKGIDLIIYENYFGYK